jgi:hypothetical protein
MKLAIQHKHGSKIVNLNRRRAIRERCLNCSAWSTSEVLNCEFTECALYNFRSGQGKQNAKLRSKAIRNYCLWCMVDSRFEVSKCPSSDCSLFAYRNSTLDRSTEIKPIPKSSHIEPVSGNKTENEYQSADIT